MSITRHIISGFIIILFSSALSAQNMAVGSLFDETSRSLQLMGKIDSSISFSIRPLANSLVISGNPVYSSIDNNYTNSYGKPVYFMHGHAKFMVLPITVIQQYNTHHPFGWNDGALIAAKGYQTLISTGIYSAIGPLEVQMQPELVYATNPSYESNSAYGTSINVGTYQKIFPGQSSIRVTAGPVSIGMSTENLWWGPGRYSSLLMSNNAPGFLHGFLSSKRPVKTGIGNFEWQLIGGWLSSDSSLSFENDHLRMKKNLAPNNTRYMNGLVLSYQPKWIPGLFVGFTRAIQTYAAPNMGAPANFFERYFPVIALAVQKKDVKNEDSLSRDQLASFFLRWVFPKAQFEVYVEYGFNDYGINLRDYLMGPSHSAAHIIGMKKVIPRGDHKRIELGIELTQMSQSPDWIVRNAGNWYEHFQIHEGYTNQNQIMGSGGGYGANVLSVDAAWVNGSKRIGFLLERADRDPQPHPVKWIDLGLGVLPQWKHNQFLFSGLFEVIKSRNYLWEMGYTRINIHTKLSIQYNF